MKKASVQSAAAAPVADCNPAEAPSVRGTKLALVSAPSPDAPAPAVDPPDDASVDYDPDEYDWVPVLRKPRIDGWSPQRQRAFIEELADCGSVARAARAVDMSVSSAYKLRRSSGGAAFSAAWAAAMQQAAHALVDAAFERALNGSEEPVFDRDGRRVGRRFRHSDRLMMFMLRKHFPERYGDRHRDRAPETCAPDVPPVAATIAALDPPRPADPAALLTPDDLDTALIVADVCDGDLPHYLRDDGRDPTRAAADAAAEEEAYITAAALRRGAAGASYDWDSPDDG